MSDFSITCSDFDEGTEIPKKFGYKFENEEPNISFNRPPSSTTTLALIMDDPDAMGAVGKVWLHWLQYHNLTQSLQSKVKLILMKLVMADLHLQMEDTRTFSKHMH